MTTTLYFDALLAPISEAMPAGENLDFDAVTDDIKFARQSDPEYLSQGDWKTTRKVADWKRVKELASDALTHRSKDLQIACWLSEALVHLHGFAGARDGFLLLDQLLSNFWESLYPPKEDDDVEVRIGRLIWLDNTLPTVLGQILLTATSEHTKNYGFLLWRESRDVDNLARQNQVVYQQVLEEGKINVEMWDEAVKKTPSQFYETLLLESKEACEAFHQLIKTLDKTFLHDAPNLAKIAAMLGSIDKLIQKIATEKGLFVQDALPDKNTDVDVDFMQEAMGTVMGLAQPISTIPKNREDALQRLHQVADFFRQHEPHSPVTYLVEKAARWGTMRLDEWLREVVQDDSTRYRLKDMLGYSEDA